MRIFVYGTLRSAALCRAVAGGEAITQTPASIGDHLVYPVAGNVVPLIRAAAGSTTHGAILEGVTPAQLARLDAYEGAFGYQLIDVTVTVADGAQAVRMYLPPEDIAVGEGPWSLADWQRDCEGVAVLAATELFAHDPALTHDQIARNWHMIEHRAWAKWTAAQMSAHATVRNVQTPVAIVETAPPLGTFFRLQQLRIRHERFDGTRSDILPRETLVGTDAAIVLPYDAKRDRILLVEQLRMGPLVRGAQNPWSLEPVAGMIDAFETPVQTALRESAEEAGLTDLELHHVTSFYPSPGSSTDYFYCYLGLCDLPDDHARFGGLETEAEDLRLHLVSYDDAMGLVASGEINAGPLITLLYALGAQRDALRKPA